MMITFFMLQTLTISIRIVSRIKSVRLSNHTYLNSNLLLTVG